MKQYQIQDWAEDTWFTDKDKSSLWVSAYRVFGVSKEFFSTGPIMIKFNKLNAIVLYGKMNYYAPPLDCEIKGSDIQIKSALEKKTFEGTCLLLIAPFDVDGAQGDESTTNQIINETVGLMVACYGRNIAFDKIYDKRIHMTSGEESCTTPPILNPLSFNAPDINDSSVSFISGMDTAIAQLESDIQRRIRLSLRWYEAALRDRDIDAFIKAWIAIETMAMPDTTNIRPINEQLSEIYEISYEEARGRFRIGALFGLRSKIVHRGKIFPIHSNLLDYMGAIYVDLLFHNLKATSQYRAESILIEPRFNLDDCLLNAQ